jgi:poly(hydroxyalkanoate) granule-associated protein
MSENVNHQGAPVTGRNLWLAGLGAAAAVTEQGKKLFDGLVERGRPVAKRQIEVVDKVGDRTAAVVQDAVKLVRDTIEHEAKAVVKRLDLMTHSDVKILSARLEALSARLDEMAAHHAVAPSEALEVIPGEVAVEKPVRPRSRAKAN